VRVADPSTGQVRPGGVGEIGPALQRPHLAGQPGEQRRLIAVARAHLEHALAAPERERLDHARDERRLGGDQVVRDRQRDVQVRAGGALGRHEGGARHLAHGAQHALVAHAAARGRGDQRVRIGSAEAAAHGRRIPYARGRLSSAIRRLRLPDAGYA
jgi:hypothetical protein